MFPFKQIDNTLTFLVPSHSLDKKYKVSLDDCECPHFQYRLKAIGGQCKHQLQLIDEALKKFKTLKDQNSQYASRQKSGKKARRSSVSIFFIGFHLGF